MYRLKNSIVRMVKEQMQQNIPGEEEDMEAAADFAVSGVLSMYYEWLTAQQVTLRQLADKAQKLLFGAVRGLLGKRTEEKE